ncbi:hypothetical protein [Rothia sp. ZJ1223]|uniref:hypothetical protein n=1 Tax=Rothia sp. ZJ1223 TaxID=2811098 RepID=UPI001958ABAF|nr:hypothetical protein [Rothia sp. ZJ1223]MBM7052098.1 hypothetical protein [Rothia sp. ZJ1223]
MKSLPALVLLLAVAVIQALGIYRYSNDSITMWGQVFFPILFALAAAYIGFKNPVRGTFTPIHYALAGIGAVLLVLTGLGVYTDMYWFYPTQLIYYIALGLLVVSLALTIASVPQSTGADAPARTPRRNKKKVPQGTRLVAVAKPTQSSQGAHNTTEAPRS